MNQLRRRSSETTPVSSLFSSRRTERIVQSVIALAAVAVLSLYAFAFVFTIFGAFDDDGYFLQAYRDFLSGKPAYDQVFAFYGPFTFYGGALIARFNAINVTHDNFRWALLPLWIIIAVLMSGIIWRWTGRFSPALIAFFLVGFRLLGLAVSNGHPQVWVILAVALLLWVGIDWVYAAHRQWQGFGTGLLIGLIFLCKINVAVFVCVAIGLAASLLLKGRLRVLFSAAFLTCAVGLGLVVFFAASTVSERYFALVYILSVAGISILAIQRPSEQSPCWRNILWLTSGLGLSLFVGVGLILLCGTTVRALFNAFIIYPAVLARSYHQPFSHAADKVAIVISIAGLSLAAATFYWRHGDERARIWLGPLKVAAGVGLLFTFIRWPQAALTGSFLFLWLLLVDDEPMSQADYANRLLLVVTALLYSLQLFPVAGTQLTWAELLPIVAAGVLLADGTNCIERNAVAARLPRLINSAAWWAGPLFAALLFLPCGRAAVSRYQEWRQEQPLGLPGAYWLRLKPIEAARLTVPVNELKQHCSVVLTIPGMYSYSIWSGVPPAEAKRINSWPFMWPAEVLNEDLPKLQQQDRGCVLVDRSEYQFFKKIAVSQRNDEILSEVQRTMNPLFTFENITLYQSVGSPAPGVARRLSNSGR